MAKRDRDIWEGHTASFFFFLQICCNFLHFVSTKLAGEYKGHTEPTKPVIGSLFSLLRSELQPERPYLYQRDLTWMLLIVKNIFHCLKDGLFIKLDCLCCRKTQILLTLVLHDHDQRKKQQEKGCGLCFCSGGRKPTTPRMHCAALDQK